MPTRPSRRFNLDRRIRLIDRGEPVVSDLGGRSYPNEVEREVFAARLSFDSSERLEDDASFALGRARYIVRYNPAYTPTHDWRVVGESGEQWEVESVQDIDRRRYREILVKVAA